MPIHIGTSSWIIPGWEKTFYPPGTKKGGELAYYASVFSSVENNSSFYGPPRPTAVETWRKSVPDDFIFSFKLYRKFTHDSFLNLNADLETELKDYVTSIGAMGPKLGAILIQTPPRLRYNRPVLHRFLKHLCYCIDQLEHKPDLAMEFRERAWLNAATYETLKEFNVALVASHTSQWPYKLVKTADTLYFRLHGPTTLYESSYSDVQLRELRDVIIPFLPDVKRVYVYFNNTKLGAALTDARRFEELCADI